MRDAITTLQRGGAPARRSLGKGRMAQGEVCGREGSYVGHHSLSCYLLPARWLQSWVR